MWLFLNKNNLSLLEDPYKHIIHNAPFNEVGPLLDGINNDKHLLPHAPTFKHSLLRFRSNTITNECLRLPQQQFPTVASIWGRGINNTLCPERLHNSITEALQQVQISSERSDLIRLERLREDVQNNNRKHNIKPPTKIRFLKVTWTGLMLLNPKSAKFKNALSRSYKASLPSIAAPAYETRIRDGEDVPRDQTLFTSAYIFICQSNIPSSFKSFQFELLNRTLISPRKLAKMHPEFIEMSFCSHCQADASSLHYTTECILPTLARSFLNEFLRERNFPEETWNSDLHYIFSWPLDQMLSKELQSQLLLITICIKKASMDIHWEPRFINFTSFQFAAKLLTTLELCKSAATASRVPDNLIIEFANYTHNNIDEIHRRHAYHISDLRNL